MDIPQYGGQCANSRDVTVVQFGQKLANIFCELNETSRQLFEWISNRVFKNEQEWRSALSVFKNSVLESAGSAGCSRNGAKEIYQQVESFLLNPTNQSVRPQFIFGYPNTNEKTKLCEINCLSSSVVLFPHLAKKNCHSSSVFLLPLMFAFSLSRTCASSPFSALSFAHFKRTPGHAHTMTRECAFPLHPGQVSGARAGAQPLRP